MNSDFSVCNVQYWRDKYVWLVIKLYSNSLGCDLFTSTQPSGSQGLFWLVGISSMLCGISSHL